MTTLRVIVDQIVAPVPGGIGTYCQQLTRELITTAPQGADVAAIIASATDEDVQRLGLALPGLAHVHKSVLPRRELELAWQYGVSWLAGGGMIHSSSLLAPLGAHDRVNDPGHQVVVTVHDTVAWSHPESYSPRWVTWHRAMLDRAHRFADAVVTPTHAVAHQLNEILDFGERVRVIGGAVSSTLALPEDADASAARLALPERYLLTVGAPERHRGVDALIHALSRPELGDIALLVVSQDGWQGIDVPAVAAEAGLAETRVRSLGPLSDADLAVVLDRAAVFVMPSLAEGFGLPMIEAFRMSTPVVHSDDPALVEVSAGSGLTVERADALGYPARLADAIARVLADQALAARLGTLGFDRSRAYSWRDSAEKVWQLHADL